MTFTCEHCKRTFQRRGNFQKHSCNICRNCGKSFTRTDSLRKHVCKESATCVDCKRIFSTKQSLQQHQCSFCSVCKTIYSSFQKKKTHKCHQLQEYDDKKDVNNQILHHQLSDKRCEHSINDIDSKNSSSRVQASNLFEDKKLPKVDCVVQTTELEQRYFKPVELQWQLLTCSVFNIPFYNKITEYKVSKPLTPPASVQPIETDGNCFFRSISFVVSGTEVFHEKLRHALILHIMRNERLLKPLLQTNISVVEHITNTKMNETGSWATEFEIFGMAHLLKTDIYTYVNCGRSSTWLKHSGNFIDKSINVQSDCSIYLNNRNNNHFEVVLDVIPVRSKQSCFLNTEERISKEFRNQEFLMCQKRKQFEEDSVTCNSDRVNVKDPRKLKNIREKERIRRKRQNLDYQQCELKRKRLDIVNSKKDRKRKAEKRQSSEFREIENKRKQDNRKNREQERKHKAEKRQSNEFREIENKRKRENQIRHELDRKCKAEKRQSNEFREIENTKKQDNRKNREQERKHKAEKRQSNEFREIENTKKQDNRKNREQERKHKAEKRQSDEFREIENTKKRHDQKNREQERKHKAERRRSADVREKECKAKRENRENLKRDIKNFHKSIEKGPEYICTCCEQLWYRESVKLAIPNITLDEDLRKKVLNGIISGDQKEWICHTCASAIAKNKLPHLSIFSVSFPERPSSFNLTNLEECLISPRIPFMRLHELPRGGQISLNGNVVNVPSNVNNTVINLPRTLDDDMCINLKFKRKLSYKHHVDFQTVRPARIKEALKYLVDNSDLYKEEGITYNEKWEPSTAIIEEATIDDKKDDAWDETNLEDQPGGTMDTLLQPQDMLADANQVYAFAPAEGNKPISIFVDKYAEELAFPTIYCGKKRTGSNISYSELCKSELRRKDRRAAGHIPNIFFKYKKLQTKHIFDKSNVCLRKTKANQCKTAGDLKSREDIEKLCHFDEGYKVFKDLRGSPPYWEKVKKEIYAMIRVLGIPTWFASFSSAETRWNHLLKILSQTVNGKKLSDEEIEELSWFEKSELIKKDPVTCARHFNHQVKRLTNDILMTEVSPVGKVTDHFYKVEFQMRGSPHIHTLLWVKNAPKINDTEENLLEVLTFIDECITCKRDPEIEQLVSLQEHKHSRTCRKKNKNICRFGFPLPPMPETCILEPLDESTPDDERKIHKDNWKKISNTLNDIKKEDNMGFREFLQSINISEDQYYNAVRSSLSSKKVFLKRAVNEIRINAYNKILLKCWRANMDLQYVLDPYSCAMYIVSYISKSQRGMSNLLYHATQEAKQGNDDLRQQVKNIGHKFLNHVEVAAQEAVYYILGMPLKQSSRQVVFINTSPPEERVIMLKSFSVIQNLPNDSPDVEATSIIKRYADRPQALANICLAEFCSKYKVVYTGRCNHHLEDQSDDEDGDKKNMSTDKYILGDGNKLVKRQHSAVIRYVRYRQSQDQENYFREILLLFNPWRSESNLKGSCESYSDQYLKLTKQENCQIINKMEEYNHRSVELDSAIAEVETLDQSELGESWDKVVPATQAIEREDENEGQKDCSSFQEFLPPSEEISTYSYLSVDNNCKNSKIDVLLNYMPDDEYYLLIQKLNQDQRCFFMKFLHHMKTEDAPIYAFLTGGAGVGKSVVVSAIYQALIRFFNVSPGSNPDDIKILLAAPTGKAAYLIKGNTIHSLLQIPANQGYAEYKPLTSDKLNTLQCKFRHVRLIIIDEISMVGNRMFSLIDQRLQQIMGRKQIFGGLSVLTVGDLYQLKPVFDGWIFSYLSHEYGPLAVNLWRDNFKIFELTQIMRQKDSVDFAFLLNRLRENRQTKQDIDLLLSRKISFSLTDPEYPIDEPHIFLKNDLVDNHNSLVCDFKPQSSYISSVAVDVIVGDISDETKEKIRHIIPLDTSKTMGLCKNFKSAFGLRNEISCNVDVEDGIANGATCVITKTGPLDAKGRYQFLWIRFLQNEIGVKCRKANKALYSKKINKQWTPLFPVKRQFSVGKYKSALVIRDQFPLRCAAAKTCHRCQGDTMDSAVVDFTGRTFEHAHYVALSRVKDIQNLHIRELNEKSIRSSKLVQNEMQRLRNNMNVFQDQLELPTDKRFIVLFQNVRSLHKHIDDIKSDFRYCKADLLLFAETKLVKSNADNDFIIPHFFMYRFDSPQSTTRHSSYGLALYSKKIIDSSCFRHKVISNSNKYIEIIGINISVDFYTKPLFVTAIYCSPAVNKRDIESAVSDFMKSAVDSEQPFLILGDFNVNLLHQKQSLFHCLQCQQHIKTVTTDYESLLDHVYITDNIEDVKCGVMESHFSDHKAVFCAF